MGTQAKARGMGLADMLAPLSDRGANKKLLAISTAQCLSSIATLLHDTYLPLFMSEVLGMSNTKMGNLHGLLQLLTRVSGVISGRLADVLSPARMVIIGVGLTALVCKPLFALCGSVHGALGTAACITWVTYAKILDRLTKGVREAPSKALVGELAHSCGDSAAAAFGVRQALSTLGMLLGSVAAGAAFQLTGRSYTATFALSVLPALAGFGLVLAALGHDAAAADAARRQREVALASGELEEERLTLAQKAKALATALPAGYWQALATTFLLYLARFDVAFITVHASTVMSRAQVPMLTLFSMAPVVLLAAPMGMRAKESMRARNAVLALGCLVLIVGDLFYAYMPSALGMVLGSTCVGVHMAMTQGVFFGMLASYIPAAPIPGVGRIAGTVWSLTDLALGVSLAYSNSLAGRLCDWTVQQGMGPTGCFLGGAVTTAAAIAALLLFAWLGELGKEPPPQAKLAAA
ncbi:hypothetical protein ABPG75_002151 [Micractinium tetrahymenae]